MGYSSPTMLNHAFTAKGGGVRLGSWMGTVSVWRCVDRVSSLWPLGHRGSKHIHVHTAVDTLNAA